MFRTRTLYLFIVTFIGSGLFASSLWAQNFDTANSDLVKLLSDTDIGSLAKQARKRGDPHRGARVFYLSAAACSKCHASGPSDAEADSALGPDLATIGKKVTYAHVVASILDPSRDIRPGYETVTIRTSAGRVIRGLVVRDGPDEIVLRNVANLEETVVMDKDDIEDKQVSKLSMMPQNLVASLLGVQEFYDLVRYVVEVAHGGPDRAAQLKPNRYALAVTDDTRDLDHAGILRSLGAEDLAAGRRIYLGHCQNCHGADGNKPNMPVARAFSNQPLKYGADPYRMFLTLSRGNGLMAPMSHLSPKERYQVVHFVRKQFLKGRNPDYAAVDDEYLQALPGGTGTGEFRFGGDRDFGPVLASQLGESINNSLTFRLSDEITLNYDLHRMRLGGVWQGGFLDLSQTHHYRQRGEEMPQIDGSPIPGLGHWQWQFNGSFDLPIDAKPPRGPVRDDWLQYYGHYLYANQAVLNYGIHGRNILETIDANSTGDLLTVQHALRIGGGNRALKLCVGRLENEGLPAGLIPWGRTVPRGRRGKVRGHLAMVDQGDSHIVVAATGQVSGMTWSVDREGRIVLTIPPFRQSRVIEIVRSQGEGADHLQELAQYVTKLEEGPQRFDLLEMTRGGPRRWPHELTVAGQLGQTINGYALDTIPVPFENPWNAWLRTSALDFFADGRAVVTTHGGDVYIVSGLDERLEAVTWRRFVAGLFEPFGVRVVSGEIYVTCRDGIKRLHDLDKNGEADFVEAFWIDDDVSSVFHAFNFDLQTDSGGNFYFAKSGGHTDHGRPGTIMRIPPEGGRAEAVAWGLRTPNGMGKLDDDRLTVSDNQGQWIPAGKVSLIRSGAFLGFMPQNEQQDAWIRARNGGELPTTFDEPVLWLPQDLDSSCGGQLWVTDQRWGPLSGRLIHSSYGKGWLYYMSLQEVGGRSQASIVKLPHQWSAGVMRLRANPGDGQVYGVGLSGWQGPPGGQDGCLQRLRHTGERCRIVEDVKVTSSGIALRFNFPLDATSAGNSSAYSAEMWNYRWSKNYGSDQFSVLHPGKVGRDRLTVQNVSVDRKLDRVHVELPELAICDQVLVTMKFKDAAGADFSEQVYLTVHAMPE